VQVGELIRLFVTKVPKDSPRVFINPDILETSIEQESFEEGCLSIPGVNADVDRPSSVRVQAWNEKGRPFSLTAEGFLARVIQHEIDHLNGILFVDRLNPKKRSRLLAEYEQIVRA
jgi:peptide deformylase